MASESYALGLNHTLIECPYARYLIPEAPVFSSELCGEHLSSCVVRVMN